IADLIRMAKIPSDAAVTLLNSVIMQQGASAKMDAILDSLYKKGYPQNSKISDLKKKRVNGSNAAMAAAAKCFGIGSDKQTEGHAACMAFAKVSKAALPQRSELAASLDEYLAFRVFEQHRRFAWNNPAQAKELVLAWGPKVTTYGKISAELLGKAWNVDSDNERVGGTYYKLLTAMMPAIIKSGDGWFERAQEVRSSLGAWMPVADKDIFKGEYGVFNGDYAFDYLFSHLRNNRWTPAYTFKQWELMLNGGDSMIFYHSIHNLCNHISDKNFKYRDQIPVSFYIALLKRIVRMTEKAKYPYFYEEARVIATVPTDKKLEVLNAYAAMTAQRSTPEKITMFNHVFAHTINQGHIPAQMRFDYIDKVLLPILKDSSVKNLRYSTLDMGVINFLSWARLSHVKETTAEQKARAIQLMKESILPVFASGNMLFPLNGDAGLIAELLEGMLLDDVLKAGDLAKVNRLAVVIATSNKADHSENRAREVMNRANAKLLKGATEQISYVYLSIPTDGDRAHNSNLKASFNRQIAKAARDIPGIVSVDKSDAAYDIFLAQQMKREGAALQAWSYVRGKMDVLTRRWKEFDFDFVIWVVEQARKSGLYKEGMELAQTIWMEEAKLAPVEAAKLGLSKGDIYRDWKSYPAAKIE
ncbi:MAG: hypothetical protein J6Q65_07275, partial [Lentisphaeria bacterium]|nr:hypothetical protein [Lentisphaeria bacterium]